MDIHRADALSASTSEFWRDRAIPDFGDHALDEAAHAAFAWYRHTIAADDGTRLDPATIERLVELQHAYLHRFPSGDLSERTWPQEGAAQSGVTA